MAEMTLILAAGNRHYTVQLSDRRVSANGKPLNEESGKAGIFRCLDARLVFGYSGLANDATGSFKTWPWILETLAECGEPDFRYKPIMDRLAIRLSEKFRTPELMRVPPKDRRLSVMFTGYLYTSDPPYMVNVIHTNFQNYITGSDSPEPWDEFRPRYGIERRPYEKEPTFIERIGYWPLFSETDAAPFRADLECRAPPQAIVGRGVELIRKLAENQKANESIGKQITSVILPSDPDRLPVVAYHTARNSRSLYFADEVVCLPGASFPVADITLSIEGASGSSAVVVTPKVHRNAPCPCNSGRQYKACHGKR
jgi:hypothetical protein